MAADVTGCSRRILDLAPAVAPEFGADVLLREIAKGEKLTLAGQRELAERAFGLAVLASNEVARKLLPGKAVDTRDGFVGAAGNLQLDRLSLQSRAVLAMTKIDPGRAREMFDQIAVAPPGPAPCKSWLIPDYSLYYRSAMAIFHTGFDREEKRRGEHIGSLLRVVNRAVSPYQLAPLAQEVRSAQLAPDEFVQVTGAMARALAASQGDDRGFSATYGDVSAGTLRLMALCHERNLSCQMLVAQSFREKPSIEAALKRVSYRQQM